MSQLSAFWNVRFRGEINFADADSVTYKSGSIPGTALAGAANVLRSQLKTGALPRTIPLDEWRVTATLALLGNAAGTPAGAFGLTAGVHGTNTPKLVGESASGNSKTNSCRKVIPLPPEYVDGETATLRVHARITADCNTAQTLDAQVFESDKEASLGSDLVAEAANSLTTSWADYDFELTAGALSAGDPLDVELTGLANDTGGSAGAVIEIGDTRIIANVR